DQRPHELGLPLRDELAWIGPTQFYVPAEQCREHFSAAVEGDIPELDPRSPLEDAVAHLVFLAGCRTPDGYRSRSLLRRRHDVFDCLERRIRFHDDQLLIDRQAG